MLCAQYIQYMYAVCCMTCAQSCATMTTAMPTGFNFGAISTLTTGQDGIGIGANTLIIAAGGINGGNGANAANGAYHQGKALYH